jgi:uracil-DNA glycosylase
MIVGEAPGETEEETGQPFVGASGIELTRMLGEAGIDRRQCFVTNVCRHRPPANKIGNFFYKKTEAKKRGIAPYGDRYPHPHIVSGLLELNREIEEVKPKIIIALGDTALWALTGESGITKYRGSMMHLRSSLASSLPTLPMVLPTIHPAAVLRQWQWRILLTHDLRRAMMGLRQGSWPSPAFDFTVRPNEDAVFAFLADIKRDLVAGPTRLAVDIETRLGHIACIGIATSKTRALCIPLMCTDNPAGYWPFETEFAIILALRDVLTHPNARIVGQNFLYDSQYIARFWHFLISMYCDTMLAQHTIFPGDMAKDLNTLSSLYCDYHMYWKDEGKDWEPGVGEEQLWIYNCKDCVSTWEISENIEKIIQREKLHEQYCFQMSMFQPVLRTMLRGVTWDRKLAGEYALVLQAKMSEYEAWFHSILPEGILPKGKVPFFRSPTQLASLFYTCLGFDPILNRKTRQPSTDDEALTKLMRKEPLLTPLCKRILEYRSLGVFYSTFVSARVEADSKVRCSYNLGGTETFRLSSSKDAFGYGLNLQNIPEGG